MVITRFAPSPTGTLHIGGVRTALFCWLFAKQQKGQFFLRIEDTDTERSTQESVDSILKSFEWLALDYEGAPVYQTDRFDRYRAVCDDFLKKGLAYRCYCSKERLEALRAKQMAEQEKPKYDGHCRHLTEVQAGTFVVRFKNPMEGLVEFEDRVRGLVSFQNSELDDFVMFRSDGVPTYNFAVVVDDADMHITHVLRGDDHVTNTPRQINIFKALGLTPPVYAHLPMILGADGARLSKRHGAVGVLQFRDEGYLKEAILNYLVRLGWSHGDQEIFSLDEMIQFFSLDHLNKSAAAFDYEKLKWVNQHYIKTLELPVLLERLQPFIQDLDLSVGPDVLAVLALVRERCQTLVELAAAIRYFYQEAIVIDSALWQEHAGSPEILAALVFFKERLGVLNEWNVEGIKALVKETLEKFSLKMPKLAMPLRLAMTGGLHSPSIDAVVYLLGRERAVRRLIAAFH